MAPDSHYAPAFRLNAVDTTGAGDIFHAGFLYGMSQGWELERILNSAARQRHSIARHGVRAEASAR